MPRLVAAEEKFVRCLQLFLALARNPDGVGVIPLYKGRGWAWRSAYRDIETLSAAGVPIRRLQRGQMIIDRKWLASFAGDVSRARDHRGSRARHVAVIARDLVATVIEALGIEVPS